MTYLIENIVRDVRVCLDQNMTDEALLQADDEDTLATDEIIRSKVADAVRMAETTSPAVLLDGGNSFSDSSVTWDDTRFSGTIALPTDFMRLLLFRMSDWERPVYAAIGNDDAEYRLQFSRFNGIRGTAQKPVCAIVQRPEGTVLEFWGSKNAEATISQALYIPMPQISDDGHIEICPRLYRAAIYYAAGLAAQTVKENDYASVLFQTAKSLII